MTAPMYDHGGPSTVPPSIADITVRLSDCGYGGITHLYPGDQVVVRAQHRHFPTFTLFGVGDTAHAAYLRLAQRVDDLMENTR